MLLATAEVNRIRKLTFLRDNEGCKEWHGAGGGGLKCKERVPRKQKSEGIFSHQSNERIVM